MAARFTVGFASILFVLMTPAAQAGGSFQPQGSPVVVIDNDFQMGPGAVSVNDPGQVAVGYLFDLGDQVVRVFEDGDQIADITFATDPFFFFLPATAGFAEGFLFTGMGTVPAKGDIGTIILNAFGLKDIDDLIKDTGEHIENSLREFDCDGSVARVYSRTRPDVLTTIVVYLVSCGDGTTLVFTAVFSNAERLSLNGAVDLTPTGARKGQVPSRALLAVSAAQTADNTIAAYAGVNPGGNPIATVLELDEDLAVERVVQISDHPMGNVFDQLDVCGDPSLSEYWLGFIDETDRARLVQIDSSKGEQIIDVGAASSTNHAVDIACDDKGNAVIAWAHSDNPPTVRVAAYDANRQLIASHDLAASFILLGLSAGMNTEGVVAIAWSDANGLQFQEFLLQGAAPTYQVTASQSGSYYDKSHDGEGWLLEVLAEETKLADGSKAPGVGVAYWFTYPPSGGGQVDSKGAGADQAWIVGVGSVSGDTISFDDALITDGATFGDGFDPEDVNRNTWGDFSFTFTGPDDGTANYSGPPAWGSGSLDMSRITNLAGLSKGNAMGKVTTIGPEISGSWYDPEHDGEGWLIEVLSDELVLIYWFSYDSDGNQAWFVGVGTIDGKTVTIEEAQIPRGATFGPGFDPDDVERDSWGTMTFTFDTCTTGTMSYVSSKGQFGSGSLNLERITSIAGLPCS